MTQRIPHLALTFGVSLALLAALSAQQPSRVVDDALLRNPPAGEWITYGRDYAETHHSPLGEITPSNVSRLGLVWSTEVGSDGKVEATPLVFDGVLYGSTAWSVLYAIEVRTGRLKWRWDPALVRTGYTGGGPRFCCGPVNRGVALYQGRVYAGLLDGRLVALDADSGQVAWVVQTTPPGSDYSITGAPRIVNGLVLIGNGGGEYGTRGYLTAYDAKTGAEKWRFWVVPGDPSKPFENDAMARAAKTWTGEWWKYGGGGNPWDGMAYDPELNLVYVGTGNGAPWNQVYRSPGGGDNLFLSSIVALNADTGAYVWHYQTTPGDNWDYNAAQPMILADLTIGGRIRKGIMQAPKNGFFYVLDRATGELLSGDPFAYTSWASEIDPKTGRPKETEKARYRLAPVRLSPSPIGAHHWPPMAYNPATGLVYFPGQETSMGYASVEKFEFKEGQWNTGTTLGTPGAGGALRVPPAPPDPNAPPAGGFLVAWDPLARKPRWRIPFQSSGGVLSTAGGLIFAGNSAGMFFAIDPATGKTLWQHQTLAGGVATPVTYLVDGRQHVSVLAGPSKGRVFTFALQ
jgi:PQQ-dependent dehydrogenase (methanol/ethanol family)